MGALHTPLHIAAMCNNIEVFIKLFNAGAKVDIKNKQGQLALDIIPLEENRAINEALLKCCKENNDKLVSFYIILGADVNCEDSEGKRPLDCLNESAPNFKKIARLLIDNGALTKPEERLNRFERDNLNEKNRHNPDDRPNSKTRPTKNKNPKVLNSLTIER